MGTMEVEIIMAAAAVEAEAIRKSELEYDYEILALI
jgi:hypothetical protein